LYAFSPRLQEMLASKAIFRQKDSIFRTQIGDSCANPRHRLCGQITRAIFSFSHAYRSSLVFHKYTIHETVHCVAVTDSKAITRGDKWPTAALAVCFKHIAGERRRNPAAKCRTYVGWFILIAPANDSSTRNEIFSITRDGSVNSLRRCHNPFVGAFAAVSITSVQRNKMRICNMLCERKLEISIKICIMKDAYCRERWFTHCAGLVSFSR